MCGMFSRRDYWVRPLGARPSLAERCQDGYLVLAVGTGAWDMMNPEHGVNRTQISTRISNDHQPPYNMGSKPFIE